MISGIPIGDPCGGPALLREFARFAHRHGWRIAAIGVGGDHVATYEALGLRTLYIGDEAFVDPRAFSLEGRPIRKVRQSVTRLRRPATPARCCAATRSTQTGWPSSTPFPTAGSAASPSAASRWRSTTSGRPSTPTPSSASRSAPTGKPHGFIHFVPVPQAGGLSLSAMRRGPHAERPDGVPALRGVPRGRDRPRARLAELQRVRRAPARRGHDLPRWQRALRFALGKADRYFQVERLLQFNRKFFPSWSRATRRSSAPRPPARGARPARRRVADRAPAAPPAPRPGGILRCQRGRPGFDVVVVSGESQAEDAGWPRESSGKTELRITKLISRSLPSLD